MQKYVLRNTLRMGPPLFLKWDIQQNPKWGHSWYHPISLGTSDIWKFPKIYVCYSEPLLVTAKSGGCLERVHVLPKPKTQQSWTWEAIFNSLLKEKTKALQTSVQRWPHQADPALLLTLEMSILWDLQQEFWEQPEPNQCLHQSGHGSSEGLGELTECFQ